jgi:arylsulfatase A-like enzyme
MPNSTALLIVAALLLAFAQRTAAAEPGIPNILILIADDLGWRDVGFHDSEIKTPTLDKLAAQGIKLERHYVCPTCSPTRCGLLTGRNPSRFGILGPISDRSTDSLPAKTRTLAQTLKERGYETALFGKWHLGLRREVGPRQYGFDQSYGYFHGQLDQYTHLYKNGDRTWHRNDEFVDEKGHATDLIAEEAVRFLDKKRKAPFFLWVAFSVPHHPVQEEEKWIAPYKESIEDPSRRIFAASVSHMDAAIGRIVTALERNGLDSNTLILFTSDNGGQQNYESKTEYEGKHGPNPTLGNNKPLRGWKTELYEGGIRVPAFATWKDKFKPRLLVEPVSYLDWFPTLGQFAGVEVDSSWKLDGRNLAQALKGESAVPAWKPLYWNTGRTRGILDADWKLIEYDGKNSKVELFNLREDPIEKTNLAEMNLQRVDEMRKLLNEARKSTSSER